MTHTYSTKKKIKKKWTTPELTILTAVIDEYVLLQCGDEYGNNFGQGENHNLPCYQSGAS